MKMYLLTTIITHTASYSLNKLHTFWKFCLIVCVLSITWIVATWNQPVQREQQAPCRTSLLEEQMLAELRDELTVVTAYFDIGKFRKGDGTTYFTPELYRQWMTVFARLESPVVAYFDIDDSVQYFTEIRRRHLPANLTKIVKIDRKELLAFRLEPDIARIFSKFFYPKHHPNTVVAGYSAAMHAKYDVMQLALSDNPFRTRYFCWLDTGLFRELVSDKADESKFSLYLPPDFRHDSVAYTEAYRRYPQYSARRIVSSNEVWVCGCFFIGRLDVLYRWTEEYQEALMKTIADEMTSTDQQVIYIAFNTMNPQTRIQTYRRDGRYGRWFHLGYVARDMGNARRGIINRNNEMKNSKNPS